MTRSLPSFRLFICVLALVLPVSIAFAASPRSRSKSKSTATRSSSSKTRATGVKARSTAVKSSKPASGKKSAVAKSPSRKARAVKSTKSSRSSKSRRTRLASKRKRVFRSPWLTPTYADSTLGDAIDGEDLTVRRVAVDALGPYNGTVVITDPETGRILTIVNQDVAFREGFQPCSTIKIYAALAGLNEGVIDRHSAMRLYGRTYMNLTDALARSNNPYFANIGVKLGYDKISYYARLYGLGEKAVLNAPEEEHGTIPPAPPANGGMGMMTSFGEGIKLSPLQLAATLGAIANGGTLYYLQYPRTQQDVANFVPQIKRHIPMQQLIPELMPGMLGATEYGTARRAYYDPNEPIFGKTGTCTDRATPTHLGWFGSFNEVDGRKLVVVVLLTGGRPVNGPVASGIAGQIYRNLSQQKYFANTRRSLPPVGLISGPGF
jgi:cell division protein FtsI/penicillin-binding protein 2